MTMRSFVAAALWLSVHGAATSAQDKTSEFPPLPRAVSSFGAAATDSHVYVYGGHSAKTHEYSTAAVVGDFYRVPIAAPRTWEKLPSGPAVQGVALVAHRGKLIRVGGMQPRNPPGTKADNYSLASCERYDPALGKWSPLPDLPEPRSSHDAVVVGDKLYVVGGWTMAGAGKPATWRDSGLVLDLATTPHVWRAMPHPFQRRALVAVALHDKIHVIGGLDAESKTHLTVAVFDTRTNSWSVGPHLPGVRRNGFSPGACASHGRLFVNPPDGGVFQLSAKGDAWEEVGEIQHRRVAHRMVATPAGQLIVLGGANGGQNVAATETVTPRAPQ